MKICDLLKIVTDGDARVACFGTRRDGVRELVAPYWLALGTTGRECALVTSTMAMRRSSGLVEQAQWLFEWCDTTSCEHLS